MSEINAVNHTDNTYDTALIYYTDLVAFDRKKVAELIPDIRSFTCFKILMLIDRYPRSCESDLIHYSKNYTAKRYIAILISLDLIRVIGKPRLIIPFQKFKVDKGYVITDKGKTVLRKLLCP